MCAGFEVGLEVSKRKAQSTKKKKIHCSLCFRTVSLGLFFFSNATENGEAVSKQEAGKDGLGQTHNPAQCDLGGGSCYRGYTLTTTSLCAAKGHFYCMEKNNL